MSVIESETDVNLSNTQSSSNGNGVPSCPICLEKFEGDSEALLCGHVFHVQCLRRWLHTSPTCPICRLSVGGNPSTVSVTPDLLAALYHLDESGEGLWTVPTPFGTFVMQIHPTVRRHMLVRYIESESQPQRRPSMNLGRRIRRFFSRLFSCFRRS